MVQNFCPCFKILQAYIVNRGLGLVFNPTPLFLSYGSGWMHFYWQRIISSFTYSTKSTAIL